ncbi:hypothetical protein SH528x_000159 [Novipirellula sp. SH528]|uniref:hypothetical protein n=1 Tax=Novipirellula sp. SH528 TaxID=3454466 RepID=UPI003F9F4A24
MVEITTIGEHESYARVVEWSADRPIRKGDRVTPIDASPADGTTRETVPNDQAAALPILDDFNPKHEDAMDAQSTHGKTLNQLQGMWRLTRQIATDGDESITPSNATWEFKGNRLIARDSGGGGAMIVTVDESHSPVHVDVELETDEETLNASDVQAEARNFADETRSFFENPSE